jgi:hypothetical protein
VRVSGSTLVRSTVVRTTHLIELPRAGERGEECIEGGRVGGGGRGGGRDEAKRRHSGRTSGAGEGVDGGAWAQPCH